MGKDLAVWIAMGGLAVLCLVLLVTVVLTQRSSALASRLAQAELSALRARIDELEHSHGTVPTIPGPHMPPPAEYVITGLGDGTATERPAPARVDGALFADTVLRETVVRAASLASGVRRGLAPATRNRIRFEMKQEVRRSRKQRRADLKAAQRNLHVRQRRAMTGDVAP